MLKNYLAKFVLYYLRTLARIQLKKNPRAVIIGVTGSAGKTSTRLAIAHILKTRGVVKQSSHANSETGIPLNILGLSPKNYSQLDWLRLIILAPLALLYNWERFNYYVVEMGIDSPNEPKNMTYLLRILQPDISVVLNAGLTHTENFDHLVKDRDVARRAAKLIHQVAIEKMKLAIGTPPSGVAIINLDQKDFQSLRSKVTARQITFGTNKHANFRIGRTIISKDGFSLSFIYQGQSHTLTLKDIFSDSYVYTFAAAIAVGAAVGIPVVDSIRTLTDSYRAPAGRLRIFPGLNGCTIIDSSYNASPATMRESLFLLSKLAGRAKKIAVLGDMRELGDTTKQAHKNLADWIYNHADEVLLFGKETLAHTYPVLVSRGFPAKHFETMEQLIKHLRITVSPKSWVLIKGSQNTILLERAVSAILQNKDDEKYLARRGSYWDRLRRTTI